jgi:hypothetical protein
MNKNTFLVILLGSVINNVYAGYKEDIGYTKLAAELGTDIPTGRGVTVTQTESLSGEVPAYMPDINKPEFKYKVITDKSSPLPLGPYSGHATGVARMFFGKHALANGITHISCYSANGWLTEDFLNANHRSIEPKAANDRVANHSWIGGIKNENVVLNILKRIDWVINRDEFIQAVGIRNKPSPNSPMLSGAFNVIAVGKSDGNNGRGSILLNRTYTAGRPRPHIVTPNGTSSGSTPIVASAIALLVETGHNNPDLSADPNTRFTITHNNKKVYNAERSEVIKAALMAGADRSTNNTTKLKDDKPNDVVNYRTDNSHRSDNGLDTRYGAGQLNIYNSYKIISAGEQNREQDNPQSKGMISNRGFDYQPAFGKAVDSTTSTYHFKTDNVVSQLTAALVWNIKVDKGTVIAFPGKATVYNLDLALYKTVDRKNILVMQSASIRDNTENLYVRLEPNSDYIIEVSAHNEEQVFEWDYAIAWQIKN